MHEALYHEDRQARESAWRVNIGEFATNSPDNFSLQLIFIECRGARI